MDNLKHPNQPAPPSVSIDFINNQSQLIPSLTKKDAASLPDPATYSNSAELFWKERGQSEQYNRGQFFGRGDKSNVLFEVFLKRWIKAIEEMSREALSKQNTTSETYKDIYDSIKSNYRVLLGTMARDKVVIKEDEFLPLFHGFINAYVESLIQKTLNPNG